MNYREMTTLAGDPARVRTTAQLILQLEAHNLLDTMQGFLTDLSKYDGLKPLSTRQLETLYSVRERASRRSKAGRYKAGPLIKIAWEARLDLVDDDAEEWLDDIHQRGPDIALSRTEWRRLFALCRKLDIIHPDEWVDFD